MFKNWDKAKLLSFIYNNLLIVFGSILLAIGTAIFLTQLRIVSGGLSGIAIIIQYYVGSEKIIDIVVAIATAVLWFVGLIFCGKEFAFKTLVSSILYPAFLSLFIRLDFSVNIANAIAGDGGVGNVLLCGLFGGVFIGAGVGLTFLGKGSTGGVDVFIFLAAKHTRIKESVWSFLIDGFVIVLSMILIPNNWINSLVGILSAFFTALMIDFVYNGNISSFQVDIISDNWETISRYAQDDLGRGATIIPVLGGYQQENRTMLRIVLEKRQVEKLRKFIAQNDPKAFVTFTQTKAVYGEGFKPHTTKKQ